MGPVEALDAALSQHLSAVQRAAYNAPPGGGPEWDGLLRHYGITPLDASERGTIVQCMHLPRGAVPAEMRMVLGGLRSWALGEIDRLKQSGAANLSPSFFQLQQRVETLVDAECAGYERALGLAPLPPAPPPPPPGGPPIVAANAPKGPSLGSIFANAQKTSQEVPWAGKQYNMVGTLTCVHCGGPQEKPQDFMCRYCRRPIAGTTKPTV